MQLAVSSGRSNGTSKRNTALTIWIKVLPAQNLSKAAINQGISQMRHVSFLVNAGKTYLGEEIRPKENQILHHFQVRRRKLATFWSNILEKITDYIFNINSNMTCFLHQMVKYFTRCAQLLVLTQVATYGTACWVCLMQMQTPRSRISLPVCEIIPFVLLDRLERSL